MARYGLEPHRLSAPNILSRNELKDYREPVDELVGVARAELDRLFARLIDQDYVVLLTDANGVTVDFRCRRELIDEARASGLYLGAVWSENSQGTNGVGTCIHARDALSIVMDDHFSTRNVGLTCTVAPIFDGDGRLEAVLDVSTPRPTDQHTQAIVRKIVRNAARRIENACFARRFPDRLVLRFSRHDDFSDSATEALIALDETGRILSMGQGAPELFSIDDDASLRGRNVQAVLGIGLDRLVEQAHSLTPVALKNRHVDHDRRVEPDHVFVRIGGYGRVVPGRTREGAVARVAVPVRRDGGVLTLDDLAGADPRMIENVEIARKVIDKNLPILLTGETGTGKGAFARALHEASRRAGKPFVAVNCTAIPRELVESELFGYRPGAFTGAFTGAVARGAKGRILEANGGTLFLDEIGEMPLALQTRLLRVLSEEEVAPLGGGGPVTVDITVISATLVDLDRLVETGAFRADLYFRLNGARLTIPALRQRRDKVVLMQGLFRGEAARAGVAAELTDAALDLMYAYFWPGNIRELRNALRFAISIADDGIVREHHLPRHMLASLGKPGAASAVESAEARMIALALKRTGWNVSATAAFLGVSRSTLHRKIKAHGLKRFSE